MSRDANRVFEDPDDIPGTWRVVHEGRLLVNKYISEFHACCALSRVEQRRQEPEYVSCE